MNELDALEEIQLDLARMRERLTQQVSDEIEDYEIRLSKLRERLEEAMKIKVA